MGKRGGGRRAAISWRWTGPRTAHEGDEPGAWQGAEGRAAFDLLTAGPRTAMGHFSAGRKHVPTGRGGAGGGLE